MTSRQQLRDGPASRRVISGGAAQYMLATSVDGGGIITLDPAGGTYDASTVVTCTAAANTFWEIASPLWTGDMGDPDTNPQDITMDGDKSITAHFDPVQQTTEWHYARACEMNLDGSVWATFPSGDNGFGTWNNPGNVVDVEADYDNPVTFASLLPPSIPNALTPFVARDFNFLESEIQATAQIDTVEIAVIIAIANTLGCSLGFHVAGLVRNFGTMDYYSYPWGGDADAITTSPAWLAWSRTPSAWGYDPQNPALKLTGSDFQSNQFGFVIKLEETGTTPRNAKVYAARMRVTWTPT